MWTIRSKNLKFAIYIYETVLQNVNYLNINIDYILVWIKFIEDEYDFFRYVYLKHRCDLTESDIQHIFQRKIKNNIKDFVY